MNAFSFDFSKDKPDIRDVIPQGTKLMLRMNYTPGGSPMDGALTKAKEGDAHYLKAEFTVLRGPFKGRKFWENMTFAGGMVDEKGNSIAAKITRGNVRSILDAARGLDPKDESPETSAKRIINGFGDLQGLVFFVKVGVEPAKGNYAAKNKLGTILTVDHKDYPKSEAELDNPVIPATAQAAATAAALPATAAPPWSAPAAAPAPLAPPAGAPPPVAPPAPMAPPTAVVQAPAAPPAPAANANANASPIPAWARG